MNDLLRRRMRCLRTLLPTVLFLATLGARAQYYNADDPVMGLYEGEWKAQNGQGTVFGHVRTLRGGKHEGFIRFNSMSGPFATVTVKSEPGKSQGSIGISGASPTNNSGFRSLNLVMEGSIAGQVMSGTLSGGQFPECTFSAKRILKKPPTLGEKPPEGAIVLFDGKDTSEWVSFPWKTVSGGSMEVVAGKGNITTKRKLRDYKLHVEFRTPFMPAATGQDRGNSGVYLQSIYEVQVLDSFGVLQTNEGDCGSVYGVRAISYNVCLPPMQWQTFDITYREGDADSGRLPTINVVQNGIPVVRDAAVPKELVGKGGGGGNPGGGLLMLQDHGHPVQFRNIWVQPLK